MFHTSRSGGFHIVDCPKAIAAALSKPSFLLPVSVALELDAISYSLIVPELLAGGMMLSAGARIVSRAILVLFLSGLARSLVTLRATADTAPWVCCKRYIPSCVNGHADSSSLGSNCPLTTTCIFGCTRGESSSSKNSVDLYSSWDAHVKRG